MRRAVMAVIGIGFTLGGIGPGLGHQPVSIGASLTADARPVIKDASLTAFIRPARNTTINTVRKKKTAGNKSAKKTIRYEGVEFSVPAGWPVYWLDKDPDQCVRYDRNAVYVGTPGPNQNCPPNLAGRADTISIGGPAASGETEGPASLDTPAKTDQRASIGGQPATARAIMKNPEMQELAVAMPASAPRIDATYGTDMGLIEQTLASIRQITPQSAALGSSTGSAKLTVSGQAKKPGWPKIPSPSSSTTAEDVWPGSGDDGPPATPAPQTPQTPQASPTTGSAPVLADNPVPANTPAPSGSAPNGAMAGFDTCTAPSLQTMKAWRAAYSATAIYIGGQMMACDYGNLNASWVQQAETMGWSLLPTFVGLQAPCDSFSGKINPKNAAAQGTAAANQAIANANSFGLGAGAPIYYDMEAYDHTNASCRTAVLTFLDAWDRQMEAEGHVPGVYSSADAAIIDLQSTTTIAGHALVEPQAIWFALWDNANNLTGSPYMSSSVWPVSVRSKQFAGNRTVKVGGISLSIDADWVNSPVVRG